MRSPEIPDVFLEKAPVTASSQRPRRCYGALVVFYRAPTEFLLAILCTLTTLSLHFHGAHIACTALSRRSHCGFTAFALRCRRDMSKMYANIRNCSNQNLNPALKTKTGNNYMCNILRGTRNLSL